MENGQYAQALMQLLAQLQNQGGNIPQEQAQPAPTDNSNIDPQTLMGLLQAFGLA